VTIKFASKLDEEKAVKKMFDVAWRLLKLETTEIQT
jgi:hypothetical protein